MKDSLRIELSALGLTLAVALGACSSDPIVYPNRNLRAAVAGATSEGGEAGEGSEAGEANGGIPNGGSGGVNAGGGKGGKGGGGGTAGNGGAPMVGPVCGDGKLEGPEECDDGNNRSGDGCSWDCKTGCEICEQNVCPLYDTEGEIPDSAYDSCYKSTEKIRKGPATGYLRSEVCQELVDCIRQESCAQVRAGVLRNQRCWCDQDWNPPKNPATACVVDPDPSKPTDPTKFIPGKCATLFQDASENGTLKDVVAALTASDLAEGRAMRLLSQCDTRVCTEECVPEYLGAGAIATISADIVVTPNAVGESPLGDLIADSQRAVAGADFALVAPSFISGTDPVDLLVAPTPHRRADAEGRVLWSEAVAVSFGYRSSDPIRGFSTNPEANLNLYKVTFTGAQIYEALRQQFGGASNGVLFVSGLKYTYTWNAASPATSTIGEVRKTDGTPLDHGATYTVALSESLKGANSPIPVLSSGTNATLLTGVVAFELLGEYIKGLPQPVAPPELNRISRLN